MYRRRWRVATAVTVSTLTPTNAKDEGWAMENDDSAEEDRLTKFASSLLRNREVRPIGVEGVPRRRRAKSPDVREKCKDLRTKPTYSSGTHAELGDRLRARKGGRDRAEITT
mmetsp:Transcript_10301/g.30378  ORF Transcript_10301/g.30378 Transcript_10301/m.30378 type:complete len:112 (+) Transcript_10301:1489-1824(+)